jgi:hypothetical protein
MAAQAEQNTRDFAATGTDAVGQNFYVLPIVTEGDRFAVEWTRVLPPQGIAAGVSRATFTGAEGAAMRGMAAGAATSFVVMRTQDVDR